MSDSPHVDFLAWIGTCIVNWAKIEEHIFRICALSLNTTEERAAIVYYKTPSLEARLTLVDELVRTVLPRRERDSGGHDPEIVREWDQLRQHVQRLLRTRNRIAHQPAVARSSEDGRTSLEIYVSETERLRGKRREGPLSLADLIQHSQDVLEAGERLHRFMTDALAKHAG